MSQLRKSLLLRIVSKFLPTTEIGVFSINLAAFYDAQVATSRRLYEKTDCLVVSSSDRVACCAGFARFIDNESKLGYRWNGSTAATRSLEGRKLTSDGGEVPASPPTFYARDDPSGISTAGWLRFVGMVISSRDEYVSAELSSPVT